MEERNYEFVDLEDCLFQLDLANKIRVRAKNEFPPKKELDLFEKATANMDDDITSTINKMKEICMVLKNEYDG